MDVRQSMYLLVDRVAEGMALDEAAQGLDLQPDAQGNHASDFLCLPGLWSKLDEARLFALVDWLLDHGTDGARLLSRTLSDNTYADAGENPIRRHLLSLSPLPDLGPALIGAFRGRRLALARAFVARGADPSVLGDWVEDDLVTPATLDVRYQASEQEQQVTLALVLRRLQPDYPAEVSPALEIPRRLVRLGGGGLLGGELFDPRSSSVVEESVESTSVDGDTEVRLSLRVRGVSPAGLALVFRWFAGRELHWYPRAIRLHGELALVHDAASVDSARARSWFRDPAVDPYLPPRAVPFTVTSKPRKKMFAMVEHRENAWRDIHKLGQLLDPEPLCATRVGFDIDDPSPFAHFDSKSAASTKTEITLKSYGGGERSDPAPLRAAFLHGLCALGCVTSVRWCDDAGAADAAAADAGAADAGAAAGAQEPPPEKPSAKKKPKPAKPVSVDHPDRGPSRIAALRTKHGAAPLPWAAVGAPAGAIPDAIPPTLRAWLTGGGATWPLSKERPFEQRTFVELVAAAHPELATALAPLGEHLLAGPCIPLFVPSSCADGTILFLHLPLADSDGEPPVLGFDPTDEGLVGVFAPRFDHYLARVLGIDKTKTTFAAGSLTDPYLSALVGRLPARQRSGARPKKGVIAVGGLIAG